MSLSVVYFDNEIMLGFRELICYFHANLHVTRWLLVAFKQRDAGEIIQVWIALPLSWLIFMYW